MEDTCLYLMGINDSNKEAFARKRDSSLISREIKSCNQLSYVSWLSFFGVTTHSHIPIRQLLITINQKALAWLAIPASAGCFPASNRVLCLTNLSTLPPSALKPFSKPLFHVTYAFFHGVIIDQSLSLGLWGPKPSCDIGPHNGSRRIIIS